MQTVHHPQDDTGFPLIRWSAIAAGAVVALGVISALYALGVSAGLAAFDIEAPGRPRHVGVFLGVFGVAAPFVGLFLGGMVAGRGSGSAAKITGFLHGLTMWGVSSVALLWVTYASIGAATQGAVSIGKGAVQAGQSVLQAGGSALTDGMDGLQDLAKEASQKARERLSIDPDDVMRAMNAKLQEHGRKPISREQAERAVKRVADQAMREKKVDRNMILDAVAQDTSLSRQDAELVADEVTQKVSAAKAELQSRLDEAKRQFDEAKQVATEKLEKAANEAAEMASKAFGSLFLALALGLVAAGGGAALGVRHKS